MWKSPTLGSKLRQINVFFWDDWAEYEEVDSGRNDDYAVWKQWEARGVTIPKKFGSIGDEW